MEFTPGTFRKLLSTLKDQGFLFKTFSEFLDGRVGKSVILRHDVDRLPANSLNFSHIEAELVIKGTYYFRAVRESLDEKIIREIADMGHEVGYHYEDMSFAQAKLRVQGSGFKVQGEELEKELAGIAIESFSENLEKLRKIVLVKTICMHGSPLSKWDSRLLWKYYDYHDFGIIGEPYFDIDFDEVLYLTDTGRQWDGEDVSIRDKALGVRRQATGENPYKDWKVKPLRYRQMTQDPGPGTQDPAPRTRHLGASAEIPRSGTGPGTQDPVPHTPYHAPFPRFHSTSDIINAARDNKLPDQIMMTFHPQRWTNKPLPWVKELVWQNVKNIGKYFLIKSRE